MKGIDETQLYMNETLNKSKARHEKQEAKFGKKQIVYGWDVFNQDTLYKAYNKRTKNLKVDKEEYQEQMKEGGLNTGDIDEDKLQRLVDDIHKQ